MKFFKAQFTVDCPRRSFSAEASDLQQFDSNQTITLVSDTGCEASFQLLGVTRSNDVDNEILDWTYVPTAESVTALPRLNGWKVVVLND